MRSDAPSCGLEGIFFPTVDLSPGHFGHAKTHRSSENGLGGSFPALGPAACSEGIRANIGLFLGMA
jgi:hypothetical protein